MSINVEIHQVEGFDSVPRYFNRNIEIFKAERGYYGRMHYEDFTVESNHYKTIRQAIDDIVSRLKEKGFTKLRTRLSFRGKKYLGERGIRHFDDSEQWTNYPDKTIAH
jgi:hypothetical protein